MSTSISSYTFVVLNEYVGITIDDVNTFELTINENESDLSLGYFTVTGETSQINHFRNFIQGQYY